MSHMEMRHGRVVNIEEVIRRARVANVEGGGGEVNGGGEGEGYESDENENRNQNRKRENRRLKMGGWVK